MVRAALFDGRTAEARPVTLAAVEDRLQLGFGDGGEDERVEPALLRAVEGSGGTRFSRTDLPGWRLRLLDPADPPLAALLPVQAKGYGRWIDRLGLWRASALFAGIAVAVLLVGHLAPAYVAPLVPQRWERDLGNSLVGDFGTLRCASPDGNAALRALADRIDPAATSADPDAAIRFSALDSSIYNAAALPGRNIVVFRGMLDDTRPTALAGVLAHEMAHVHRRHVTQALIREFGIGSLIRLFAGGIGANTEQLVGLSFTRANEAEADADAIAALRRADVDPRPTAALFFKLSHLTGDQRGDDRLAFLNSHPVSIDRAIAFYRSYVPGHAYRPVLMPAQAQALAAICGPPQPDAGPGTKIRRLLDRWRRPR
ncbi:M48 family metallopeptidase [Sphingomonas sp. ASV193]|uniref:M48 family metallopeptidase n=1 Tax=Sphingomonas sp. ASV193 TaxID=3144405 RepID=UPI0032E8AC0F